MMSIFGHEERQARRIIIAGGGNVGVFLAQLIRDEHPGVNARIIEFNKTRAESAARRLPGTTVINGNALAPTILGEAGVAVTEAIVAVTNDDETNILGSLLAKRHGAQRAIALVNNTNYSPLITTLGVDVVISPRSITASTILQHVRRGRIRAVHSLGEDFGEVMEAEILETSSLAGLQIREMELPEGVMFGSIVRGEKVITPRSNTVLNKGDRVVIFVRPSAVREIERLFAVSLEFF
jgi:trk system potassium uptake protein